MGGGAISSHTEWIEIAIYSVQETQTSLCDPEDIFTQSLCRVTFLSLFIDCPQTKIIMILTFIGPYFILSRGWPLRASLAFRHPLNIIFVVFLFIVFDVVNVIWYWNKLWIELKEKKLNWEVNFKEGTSYHDNIPKCVSTPEMYFVYILSKWDQQHSIQIMCQNETFYTLLKLKTAFLWFV